MGGSEDLESSYLDSPGAIAGNGIGNGKSLTGGSNCRDGFCRIRCLGGNGESASMQWLDLCVDNIVLRGGARMRMDMGDGIWNMRHETLGMRYEV